MPGAAASPYAFLIIAIWWAGVVLLGLALVYAVVRAGRLRRDERARLDRTTQALVDEDERARAIPDERPLGSTNPRVGPRPVVVADFGLPAVVAVFAIALIVLATVNGSPPAQQATTTGRASGPAAQNQHGDQRPPVQAPEQSGNQPGSDSARNPGAVDQTALNARVVAARSNASQQLDRSCQSFGTSRAPSCWSPAIKIRW